jgi:hypothetical protein
MQTLASACRTTDCCPVFDGSGSHYVTAVKLLNGLYLPAGFVSTVGLLMFMVPGGGLEPPRPV